MQHQKHNQKENIMTPDRLVDWAVSVAICVFILSATGIQDSIAGLFGSKRTRKDLEERIATLEGRIEQLEKKP